MNFLFSTTTSIDTTSIINDITNWGKGKGISIIDYLFKMLIALIVFIIIKKILNKLIMAIEKRLKLKHVDQIASHFILNLIKYSLLAFIFVTIITQLHIVEGTSIAALVASAGVGISLAMQGALSNFAGGVLLLMLRPFKKGDYIIVPGENVEGVVEIIEIYYTTVRTIYDETVSIPNSRLTNNSVINKHGNNNRVLVVSFEISYQSDIDKSKELVLSILESQDAVIKNSLSVFVDELGESGVKMGALMVVPVSSYLTVKRAVSEQIPKIFNDNNIEIPYRQLDVHIIEKAD